MDIIKKEISQLYFTGERPLFNQEHLSIKKTIFGEGESPLKECSNIEIKDSMFKWKYPLWYSEDILVKNCVWCEMARAGVWYSKYLDISDCMIEAPKNFRHCHGLSLSNVFLPNAAETLWNCEAVVMKHVVAKGDYFAMNSQNVTASDFELAGDYPFDGATDVEIHNAKMLSKDAFWNSRNVTVYDSFISGEYLGWNSKNLTFINCTIESLQGMCYINNLVMKNCRLLNTTLAFEYSTVDVEVIGKIDSVINPAEGIIRADEIGELIMEKDKIYPEKTEIVCRGRQVNKR
ncbi:MAG TPA: DUF3737 domain-containing protein [Lachnospiraceae bacterium]|nr:DUF3737 domain-containing protein [Lachnospiraceae bacterium]